jgi:pimeloyl-ACP methyl ester carboxylesterase
MLTAPDGHNIPFIEREVGPHAVLLCHGITSSKEEGGFFRRLSDQLTNESVSTIRFDFRGHGESGIAAVEATIAGMLCDLHSAYAYTATKYRNVSIIAASFGAALLLLLLQKCALNKLASLVLLNPVTDFASTFTNCSSAWARGFFPCGGLGEVFNSRSLIKIGETHMMGTPMAVEMFYYHPENTSNLLTVPTLILHGQRDSIVSIEDSRRFAQQHSKGLIRLTELVNSNHGLEEDETLVVEQIRAFFQDAIPA